MAFSVSNSVALVSGANRGIGRSVVEALLERGAKKVYAGVRKLESLGDLGDRVVGVEFDITNSDQLKAAAETASDTNLLINNAGIVAGRIGLSITDPDSLSAARNEMDVNFHGTLSASQAFAPILAANGGGTLVNLVSVAGIVNFPLLVTYSASKAALHSLTQAAASRPGRARHLCGRGLPRTGRHRARRWGRDG